MSDAPGILVIGIGSRHGDDCIGWSVVDRIEAEDLAGVVCQKVRVPMDILEFLEGVRKVHLVDAATGLPANAFVQRITNIHAIDLEANFASDAQGGTHGIGVIAALQLAESLGFTLDSLTIWLGRGISFEPLDGPSEVAQRSIDQCAASIIAESI